jgi:hypothetical protein
MVILLCADARPDVSVNARAAAANLPNIILMGSSVNLSVERTLEQCAGLEKVTPRHSRRA